jgi:spore germination cell wall hydrolase CwlJ-like protein
MFSNRNLIIIGCTMLGLLLLRQELRMDKVEDKLDQINDIIQTTDKVKYNKNDLDCLTRNVYYEAGVEDRAGKYAVAHVTVNRLKTGYWGNSVCKVVYAKKQFSWTEQKRLPRPDPTVWAESRDVAVKVLTGYRVSGLMHSLYYHAIYIKDPKWADTRHEAGQIGNHVFYNRAKGSNIEI